MVSKKFYEKLKRNCKESFEKVFVLEGSEEKSLDSDVLSCKTTIGLIGRFRAAKKQGDGG